MNKKTAENSLVPGDHGTTYGGNPLACCAVSTVLDIFEKEKIVEHVVETTPYFEKKLDELAGEVSWISERRGAGFMQGLVVTGRPVGEVINAALEKGLLVISAGSDVLRLVPPLITDKAEIDLLCDILRTV